MNYDFLPTHIRDHYPSLRNLAEYLTITNLILAAPGTAPSGFDSGCNIDMDISSSGAEMSHPRCRPGSYMAISLDVWSDI